MKKRMNIGELRAYCEQTAPQRIAFCTENQRRPVTAETLTIREFFSQISVFDRHALVCLSADNGTVCFQCVRYAVIDTEATILGTLITLCCGYGIPGEDVSYTLVVA